MARIAHHSKASACFGICKIRTLIRKKIFFPRQHRGQTATLKFIWQGKTIEKKLDKIPESVKLDNVELGEGTGFMEAQLHIDGKMWGVQEVQIEVAKK